MLVGYIMPRVCLRWDHFFRLPFCNIWGCMCWPGPFEFRWLKGYIYIPFYYHHQIGSIHLSHCSQIFSVVVCLRWLYYHILSSITYISPEHWDLVSIIDAGSIDVQSMVFANDRIHYGLQVVFVCLQITPSHYHHFASNKMLFRYMLPSVCLRLRLFSQLSFFQYMGLCVISSPNSPVMTVRICALSYYHHQIGSMNH